MPNFFFFSLPQSFFTRVFRSEKKKLNPMRASSHTLGDTSVFENLRKTIKASAVNVTRQSETHTFALLRQFPLHCNSSREKNSQRSTLCDGAQKTRDEIINSIYFYYVQRIIIIVITGEKKIMRNERQKNSVSVHCA